MPPDHVLCGTEGGRGAVLTPLGGPGQSTPAYSCRGWAKAGAVAADARLDGGKQISSSPWWHEQGSGGRTLTPA